MPDPLGSVLVGARLDVVVPTGFGWPGYSQYGPRFSKSLMVSALGDSLTV